MVENCDDGDDSAKSLQKEHTRKNREIDGNDNNEGDDDNGN